MPRVVELNTRRLNRILKQVPGNTSNAVAKVAFTVERKAKINSAVDTGANRAGIYTRVGTRKDNFDQAAAAVHGRNPEAEIAELPEPRNNQTAHVGPSTEYGVWLELGTSRQAAQPFLAPAVRDTERELAEFFRNVVTDG